MSTTFRQPLALLLAACLAALTVSLFADSAPASKGLEALYARYDREPAGPSKEKLAAQIDAAAHQRYATISRLYWHTDLESATAAARLHNRPILHLRMLGRLDEDLSCANSRMFRATLYANQAVSAFLREKFILYWSSERPVPRVTIDYGDGRKLERTITGNSAHYVLDHDGNVLDVLPGLYAPAAFRRELQGSLTLAARVRATSDDERAKALADYHGDRVRAAKLDWERFAGIVRATQLGPQAKVDTNLAAAQLRTFTKSAVELKDLRYFARELAPEMVSEDQIEWWSAVGQALYGIAGPVVIDDASRALVIRLHDAVPGELRTTDQQRDAMIAGLQQTLAADSALNQLRLRPQIGREIVRLGGRIDFATLNAWIYAEVFRTPKQDPWLGLLPRNVFSGLLGDGVVVR
jgi:hypothetical protein